MSLAPQIVAFIQAHSVFAGPMGFAVAFFGCLLGTNVVVPAGAILTAMGVLTGAGVIPWTFAPWVTVGAALGMSASFTLGLRFGARLENMPLLRTRPKLMERARRLFERYGFFAILVAYFAGPLRAPVASVAAISAMSRGRFELANVVSSIVWTICGIGVGALPGAIIEPDSFWLPVGFVLMPAATVGLSVGLMFLRAALQRRLPRADLET
jgi:membrane protein DedA with SNARE-associated domain